MIDGCLSRQSMFVPFGGVDRAVSGGEALVVAIHAVALDDLDHVALLGRLD
jgi:hypothetical protein